MSLGRSLVRVVCVFRTVLSECCVSLERSLVSVVCVFRTIFSECCVSLG